MVRVGPDGGVRFQNSAGTVGLKASVVGYLSTNGGGGALKPLRRTPLGGASPLSVGTSSVSVDVAGRAGVPTEAKAVVLAIRRPGKSPVSALWAWPAGDETAGDTDLGTATRERERVAGGGAPRWQREYPGGR